MKNRRKKEKSPEMERNEQIFNCFAEELAQAVVVDAKDEHLETLEPFEQYSQKLRERILSDLHTFRARFVKGYHALLEELILEEAQTKHLPPKTGDIKP